MESIATLIKLVSKSMKCYLPFFKDLKKTKKVKWTEES